MKDLRENIETNKYSVTVGLKPILDQVEQEVDKSISKNVPLPSDSQLHRIAKKISLYASIFSLPETGYATTTATTTTTSKLYDFPPPANGISARQISLDAKYAKSREAMAGTDTATRLVAERYFSSPLSSAVLKNDVCVEPLRTPTSRLFNGELEKSNLELQDKAFVFERQAADLHALQVDNGLLPNLKSEISSLKAEKNSLLSREEEYERKGKRFEEEGKKKDQLIAQLTAELEALKVEKHTADLALKDSQMIQFQTATAVEIERLKKLQHDTHHAMTGKDQLVAQFTAELEALKLEKHTADLALKDSQMIQLQTTQIEQLKLKHAIDQVAVERANIVTNEKLWARLEDAQSARIARLELDLETQSNISKDLALVLKRFEAASVGGFTSDPGYVSGQVQ